MNSAHKERMRLRSLLSDPAGRKPDNRGAEFACWRTADRPVLDLQQIGFKFVDKQTNHGKQ